MYIKKHLLNRTNCYEDHEVRSYETATIRSFLATSNQKFFSITLPYIGYVSFALTMNFKGAPSTARPWLLYWNPSVLFHLITVMAVFTQAPCYRFG